MIFDSNIIIYSATPACQFLRDMVKREAPSVSIVSIVEVRGFPQILPGQDKYFREFFEQALVLDVDKQVAERAVGLRQTKKMSLGDAIIAATALRHGHLLVTRNTEDFKWIEGLQLLNPFGANPA